MKKVSKKEWKEKADNFQKRIADNPYPKNIQFYVDILKKVKFMGIEVLDVGCGDCHLRDAHQIFQNSNNKPSYYTGTDPFPRTDDVWSISAEELYDIHLIQKYETVFCLAALDNVQDLNKALKGIKKSSCRNVVILTGIGIEPDHLHTVRVDRSDLTDVFGEPVTEIEIKKNVFLFEFEV